MLFYLDTRDRSGIHSCTSTACHMHFNSAPRIRSTCESLSPCLDLLPQIDVVMEGRDNFQSSGVTILVRLTPVT
jgi:hypothetical protein